MMIDIYFVIKTLQNYKKKSKNNTLIDIILIYF